MYECLLQFFRRLLAFPGNCSGVLFLWVFFQHTRFTAWMSSSLKNQCVEYIKLCKTKSAGYLAKYKTCFDNGQRYDLGEMLK